MKIREVLPWNWSKKEQVVPAASEGWSPFLSRDLEDFFDAWARRPLGALRSEAGEGAFLPALDARETGDEIQIKVELPGLSEDDIEIAIDPDHLTIQGEKQQERTHGKDDEHQWVERRFGSFRRVIPLPPDVDEEKVQARFEKGVLHITVPRTPQEQPQRRTIPIQAG